jgi:tryptophanyl-tRNA synthetase
MAQSTVLSGMRPTDRLHLGNLLGALENWKGLQEKHRCFFMIADWHALTTEYANPKMLGENVRQVALDFLATGLDPKKSTIFVQSAVPQHAELHLILSMVVPIPWLERNPTYKEQLEEIKGKDLRTYGFLGYPILQAADILVYKADLVPVGMDQLPHLELSREIVRRFNSLYGPIFPEPTALTTQVPKLPGTDGRKMSKSYNNAIYLSDSPQAMRKKVSGMVTDPARIRREDKGHPEVCPVYALHKIYRSQTVEGTGKGCREATIGCVDCKGHLLDGLQDAMKPIQERRQELQGQPKIVDAILEEGNERARKEAAKTMVEVHEAIGIAGQK